MILLKSSRARETVIVKAMINMYCDTNHAYKGLLCPECKILAEYAEKRLLSCMYGKLKPVCKNCPVHCYSPQMREQMRKVMRWSGPRMMYKKPLFALIHFIDNLTLHKQKLLIISKKK